MRAKLKYWVWVPQSWQAPLSNRPKMVQAPSGACTFTDCRETERPRSGQTVSGYGNKLPTPYMVQFAGRWRRVYAACFGNAATLYIGKPGEWIATVETIDGRPT
jgi:hypothetical protein